MHVDAKYLVPETNMAVENSAELDAIIAAWFIAATNYWQWNKLNNEII